MRISSFGRCTFLLMLAIRSDFSYIIFVIFLNKTEADFHLWCREIVPNALNDRKAFKRKLLDANRERERYDEVLSVYRHLSTLRYIMDEAHTTFLDRYLIGAESYERTAINAELYREVYETWCRICFPNGLLSEKGIDNLTLGQKLKALRIKKDLGVNRVSDLTGIDKKTLYSYEEGKRQVKLDVMFKFACLYGFKIDELLAENEVVIAKKGVYYAK